MTRTTSCARPPCRCRGVSRCRGRRGWRAAAAPSCRSWTWMRWEIRSDDHRRRRPTRHLQGGRPGPGLQHLPGRADPPVRSPRAAPQGTRFLEGVLRYQGAAVPLVDLRKRLSVPAPLREETRTVILEWEGGKLGVIVDAVTEVLHVAATEITSPPTIVKGLAAEYITGLVVKDGRTIIVLNTARLLTSKEKLALEAAVREPAKA